MSAKAVRRMTRIHTISSAYRQFYVADVELDPDAPEEWSDEDVDKRFNALEHIVALCPEGDLTARIVCLPVGERYTTEEPPAFEVTTQVSIESGRMAVFEWPRQAIQEYAVEPGVYAIRFRGYDLDKVAEEKDYYVVEFESA